ncbi:MAG: glycosyltransferase family 9 protein [Verrucomicrobiales bacterium]|nr:glycosyltransferase family 9 protein [Verrucomicrobiales bacterium]
MPRSPLQSEAAGRLAAASSALVIKPSSLGDVIHTLPAVERLHRHRPELAIDWVVNTEWAPLLDGNPCLRRVIPLPRREWRGWRDLPTARRWARDTLGPLQPDLVLDFQGLLRSALLAKASGGKFRVGFRRAREGAPLFYHHRVEVAAWERTHAVDRYLQLVTDLGVPAEGAEQVHFPLPEGESVSGDGFSAEGPPFLLLHPFSRGRGKSMSFEEVTALCERLPEHPIVLVGAGVSWPTDRPRPAHVVDLLGRTSLLQLIWLMRRARWIASVDSGPMHLAAAVTPRLLSLHTWTDPLMVGPWRRDAWIWRDGNILPVRDVEPGQFPEDRRARDRYADGILPEPGALDHVAGFLARRMAEGD